MKLGLINPKWEVSPQAGDWAGVKNKAWEARCMEVFAAMAAQDPHWKLLLVGTGEMAGFDPRLAKVVAIGASFAATWLLRSKIVFRPAN